MPPLTKNLGLVRAIHVGINPPINVKMIWYNITPGINKHYYYDVVDLVWKPLNSNFQAIIEDYILYKSYTAQLIGNETTPVWIQWKNDINLATEPVFFRISQGIYKIQTSTPILPTVSDFPIGYRSFLANGCKLNGEDSVIITPNLINDADNEFTFSVFDATTNLLTDDFVISIEVKVFPPPPEEVS